MDLMVRKKYSEISCWCNVKIIFIFFLSDVLKEDQLRFSRRKRCLKKLLTT